jgi:hypothetical protein
LIREICSNDQDVEAERNQDHLSAEGGGAAEHDREIGRDEHGFPPAVVVYVDAAVDVLGVREELFVDKVADFERDVGEFAESGVRVYDLVVPRVA